MGYLPCSKRCSSVITPTPTKRAVPNGGCSKATDYDTTSEEWPHAVVSCEEQAGSELVVGVPAVGDRTVQIPAVGEELGGIAVVALTAK